MTGRLSLPEGLRPEELDALSRLLGRRIGPGARSLALDDLAQMLARAGIPSILAGVEAVTGACRDLRDERQRAQENWKALFQEAKTLSSCDPALAEWIDSLERTGLLRRYSGAALEAGKKLLLKAIGIASALPASGIALSELAASTQGDSHALDHGTSLGALVLRAAARISGSTADRRTSEGRRTIWESVGVFPDEVSASVLVLNLRAEPGSLCSETLIAHAEAGEPCRLTFREIVRRPPLFGSLYQGQTVSVCENPTVLAYVADHLGPAAAPLICIEGKPRTPAARLLRALVESGARIRYHGDFDWEGLRIANFIIRRFEATPWRMGTHDYKTASVAGGKKLNGSPVAADWDPFLKSAMETVGLAVHEEAVLETLCQDLRDPT